MKYMSFSAMMLICLAITHPVISQTTLSGTYSESMYLSLNNSPYLVVDSAIFEGPDLRIDRGVFITFKFHPDAERKAYMRIRSTISLPESDGDPQAIIFTSERDNKPEDLNGDEGASRPAPGDWGYVHFDPGNPANYIVNLDYLTFRYGGGRASGSQTDDRLFPMTTVSDYNESGRHEERMVFFRCNFTQSAGVGFSAGMGILDDCLVSNNHHGIQIRTSDALLKNTLISENKMYPIYLIDPLIKRDDIDNINSVIDWYYNNQVEGNAVNAIAMEGTISQAHDDKDPSRWTQLQNLDLPYLITNDLIIDSLDMFVESGTLVKFLPRAYTGKALSIIAKNTGTLNAYDGVVFTSLHDYTYDLQPPERIEADPVPGDWGIISTEMPLMLGAIFRYGGKYVSSSDGQNKPDSSAVLHITGPRERGITSIGFNPWGEIEGCVFQKLYLHGIQVPLPEPGSARVSITGNSFFLDQDSYGVRTHWEADPEDLDVNAHGNYWNGKKGPFHPDLNAEGNGCRVGDYVAFLDYLSMPEIGDPQEYSILRGRVTDLKDNPVINAAVTLLSKSPKTVYTNEQGLYYLSGIKPGAGYELKVKAKAYRADKVAPLDIPADTSLQIPFRLEELSIDYALDRNSFQINPEESSVSVGGTAHRYYRIIDIVSKEPVYGVEVLVPGVDTFISDTRGIVDVAIPASAVGSANRSKSFEILRIGLETLDIPGDQRESFRVNVRPYKYRKIWSGSTFFTVGISGVQAQKERGAAIDLHLKDEGSGALADSIRMVRQSRVGFGVSQGANAKIELGSVEAGAEAGVGVNLDNIFEDDFKFDYPNNTGPQALAKFIVMANGALPYMSASLTRYFVSALERRVDDIDKAALSNAIGMNLHGYASAEAKLDLDLLEGDEASLGAEIKGSTSISSDITYMARRDAHRNPVSGKYPLDIGFNVSSEIKAETGFSVGLDLSKLFGIEEENKPSKSGHKVDSNLPFPLPSEDLGLDLLGGEVSGSLRFGYHFATRRFTSHPSCRLGFMYGYSYTLEGNILEQSAGFSQNREFNYSFDIYDSEIIETISESTELANSLLSSDNLLKLNISDLTSGKFFNNPMNSIAYQQTRNSFSLAPVPYKKTVSEQVDEGSFKLAINVGISVVSAKFGAGFKYKEVNTYQKENGLFYNWKLYPLESYEFLENNDEYKARLIVQDIVNTSADYLIGEVKRKIIPPIFRKIKIWPFNKKSAGSYVPIGPDSRTSQLVFADSSTVFSIEGIDSLDVIYWDWYGTGEESSLKKAASKPDLYALNEYVKKSATRIHKLDYGIGGFYQFEPYNVSVGDNQVDVVINYFEEELLVMLNDSSTYRISESDLRMYKEDQEQNKWTFIGGVVDTVNNTVKARIDGFGTFTLAPFIPSGNLQLMASLDSIMPVGSMMPDGFMMPEGSMMTEDAWTKSMIQSVNLKYNTGVQVSNGELFTLKASRGSFEGDDADKSREGFQVAAMGGMIQAMYMADSLTGDVRIVAESVVGDARGSIDIFVYDSLAPQAPLLSGVSMVDEEVHLHWQPGKEEDITAYFVHYDTVSGGPYKGTASVFGDASPVLAGLDSSINLAGLDPGKQYFFSITAIDRCGNMSEYSNELSVFTEINYRPVFYHRVIHIEPDLARGTVIDTLLARDDDEDQVLSFYFTEENKEDAFAIDPSTGVLSVANSNRLNYFTTRIDTFLLHVGVVDNASTPARDEGLVLVVLDVETWVPSYQDEQSASLELYPNPARDYVSVKLGESAILGQFNLAVYGSDGKRHVSISYEHINQYEIQLPVGQLEEGVYHVVLESESGKRIGKLVILE
jgi:hypothetical protein